MATMIDEVLYPDFKALQVRAETEQSKTNRLYALNDFLKTRPVFPGTEANPSPHSEELYTTAFDMVMMAVAALATDTMDWVEEGQRERDEG